MRAHRIERAAQRTGSQRAKQSARRQRPAHFRERQQRHLRRQRQQHQHRSEYLGQGRLDRPAAQPMQRQQHERDRKQKRRVPAQLECQVGDMRAHRPNPVPRWMSGDRRSGDVECRIARGIRQQAERQQRGHGSADETDQFV